MAVPHRQQHFGLTAAPADCAPWSAAETSWSDGSVAIALVLLGDAARGAASFDQSPIGEVIVAAAPERDPRDPAKGNRLAMLGGGHDALLVRVHLIRQARSSIAIQTFIWTNDECGRLLIYELIEAARRGVKVRIVFIAGGRNIENTDFDHSTTMNFREGNHDAARQGRRLAADAGVVTATRGEVGE